MLLGLGSLIMGLTTCTSDGAEHRVTTTSAAAAAVEKSGPASSCDASVINDAIERFVRAWNRNDAITLKEMLTPIATLAVSGQHQGTAFGEGKSSPSLAGWEDIGPFVESQHDLGQRLSYERLQVLDRTGAYAVGMQATYADGSRQMMRDAKFVFSCAEQAFERMVLIARAPARQDR
jgi:hypothetical protein